MSELGATIELDFQRDGKPGVGTMTAKLGGETLAAESLNVLKLKQREAFVARLREGRPGIDDTATEAVRLKLLQFAGDATVPVRETSSKGSRATFDARLAGEKIPEVSEADRREAMDMLRDPELVRVVVDDIASLGVAGEKGLATTLYLVGTSRLLTRPLAAIVQGPTSSGKSYIVEALSRLFPPETVLHAQRMTPQALYHLQPGALEHRFIVAGERSRRQDDDTADATRALREMLSDGKLTKLVPEKRDGGRIETVHIEQPGPIAHVESTTLQDILDEDRNRCLVLSTDETPAQTRRIIEGIATRKAATVEGVNVEAVLRRHHAAQRMLLRCRVVIPFAPRLGDLFPKERTDARRTFGHVLAVIEAVALLHQYQRVAEPAAGVAVVATRDDYALARRLIVEPIARSLGSGVSPAAQRLAERIYETFGGGEFSTGDIAKTEGIIGDVQTIRGYVKALADVELLEQTVEARGRRPAKYRWASPRDDATRAVLPTVEEVFEDADSSARRRVNAELVVP